MRVDAADYSGTRAHLRAAAPVDSPYDFNRDGRVDAIDLNLVRANLFASLPPPSPAPASPATAPAAARTAARHRSAWLDLAAAAG